MGIYDRKRKPVVIKAAWFKLASEPKPRGFWMEVGKAVKAAKVRSNDLDRVRVIVARIEAETVGNEW